MKCLKYKIRNYSIIFKLQNISGRKWYQLEACRALNQAVGRIIRHAADYGAILFCDGRCDDFSVRLNLSQWVSGRLKSYDKFHEGISDLAKFFGSSLQVSIHFFGKSTTLSLKY